MYQRKEGKDYITFTIFSLLKDLKNNPDKKDSKIQVEEKDKNILFESETFAPCGLEIDLSKCINCSIIVESAELTTYTGINDTCQVKLCSGFDKSLTIENSDLSGISLDGIDFVYLKNCRNLFKNNAAVYMVSIEGEYDSLNYINVEEIDLTTHAVISNNYVKRLNITNAEIEEDSIKCNNLEELECIDSVVKLKNFDYLPKLQKLTYINCTFPNGRLCLTKGNTLFR